MSEKLWKDMSFSEKPKAHPSTERLEIDKLREEITRLRAKVEKADALADVMEEYSKYTDWFPQKAYAALAAYREADT